MPAIEVGPPSKRETKEFIEQLRFWMSGKDWSSVIEQAAEETPPAHLYREYQANGDITITIFIPNARHHKTRPHPERTPRRRRKGEGR
jgi:hypothetical protein